MKLNAPYFFVRSGYKILRIDIDRLLYIKSMHKYVCFFTLDQEIKTLLSLAELELKLPAHIFMRIHKQYIVNITKINCIEGNRIVLQQQLTLNINKASKPELIKKLDHYELL